LRSIAGISLAFGLSIYCYASVPVVNPDVMEVSSFDETSVLSLYCQLAPDQYFQSRLAILETLDKDFDFGLTTAHGLVDENERILTNCNVLGLDGKLHPIEMTFVPMNYGAGTETDWAVLKVRKFKDEDLRRHKLPLFSEALIREFKTAANLVQFARSRGIGVNNQNCMSLPGDFAGLKSGSILVHDCRAFPGQSGSPLTLRIENQSTIVGIHLGKSFIVRSPVTQKPENLGYFRFVDPEFVLEIESAIRSLSHESQRYD